MAPLVSKHCEPYLPPLKIYPCLAVNTHVLELNHKLMEKALAAVGQVARIAQDNTCIVDAALENKPHH